MPPADTTPQTQTQTGQSRAWWDLGMWAVSYACFWIVMYPCVTRYVQGAVG